MDEIRVERIRCKTRLGVPAEERLSPQKVEFFITLWVDSAAAVNTDQLELSVDYTELINSIIDMAEREETRLLEALAEKAAREVLQFMKVEGVQLRARKFPADLMDRIDHVEVVIRRGNCG